MQINTRNGTINPAGSPKVTDTTARGDDETTPFENFEGLVTNLLKVPKEEVDEKRAEHDREKKRAQ